MLAYTPAELALVGYINSSIPTCAGTCVKNPLNRKLFFPFIYDQNFSLIPLFTCQNQVIPILSEYSVTLTILLGTCGDAGIQTQVQYKRQY